MSVTWSGQPGGGVVQPANDMDVIPERRQRRETGSERIAGADLCWNPVPLGNAVTIKPQQEPRFDGALQHFARCCLSRVSCPVVVNHRFQMWQPHSYDCACQAYSF